MEVLNATHKRKDTNLLVITQLCQLLTFVTGFGGLVVPLILWATQRDKVEGMNVHGKQIINFQLSIILLSIISIPLILALGFGILLLILIGIASFVLPILNAIKARNEEPPIEFLTIQFIK
jgi:uncharacterized Tic20 family protein